LQSVINQFNASSITSDKDAPNISVNPDRQERLKQGVDLDLC